jgi:Secretion system C-terminal sorting domain
MKSIIFTFLLLVVSFCNVLAQKQEVTNILSEKFNNSLKVWENQGVKNRISKSFDANDKVVKLTNGYGEVQNYELSYEFDNKGRNIKISRKISSSYISKLYYKGDEEWSYYEDTDKLSAYSTYDFDFNRNQRIKRIETKYDYDTQKRLIAVTNSSLPDLRFKAGELNLTNERIIRYTYDEKNRIILTENEEFYSGNSNKTQFFYGQNGKIVMQLSYFREFTSKEWRLFSKSESEYDNKGNAVLTKYFSFQYDIPNDSLVLTRKDEFEYDNKGNNILIKNSQIIDTISKDSLILIKKQEFQFDSRGNKILTKYYSLEYGISKDSLILGNKEEVRFDEKNREVFRQSSSFNSLLKRLVVNYRIVSEFNNDDLLSRQFHASFYRELDIINSGSDSIAVSSGITYAQYYPDKKPKEYLFESRYKDFNGKETLEIFRTLFDYEIMNSTNEIDIFKNYIVFPNPATNKITVANTLNDDCLESVALCDVTGRAIMNLNKKESPFCTWEIELPPTLQKGMYVLFMTAYNGKTTGRQVFIQR